MYFIENDNFGDPYVYFSVDLDVDTEIQGGFSYEDDGFELEYDNLDSDDLDKLRNSALSNFWAKIIAGIEDSGLVTEVSEDLDEDWSPSFYCAPGNEKQLIEYIKNYFDCDLKIFDSGESDYVSYFAYGKLPWTYSSYSYDPPESEEYYGTVEVDISVSLRSVGEILLEK